MGVFCYVSFIKFVILSFIQIFMLFFVVVSLDVVVIFVCINLPSCFVGSVLLPRLYVQFTSIIISDALYKYYIFVGG